MIPVFNVDEYELIIQESDEVKHAREELRIRTAEIYDYFDSKIGREFTPEEAYYACAEEMGKIYDFYEPLFMKSVPKAIILKRKSLSNQLDKMEEITQNRQNGNK